MISYKKHLTRNSFHNGETIAHDKRYIQVATLSGNLNMPIYENKLVTLFYGDNMKKIFVLFFLLLLGINSYAVDSKGMKWCSALSGISEMIMKSRQNGVDMEKLMEINTKFRLY